MVVLDSWAAVAHLRNEGAADRVREAWLEDGAAMCTVNLGEVLYLELRVRGYEDGHGAVRELIAGVTVVEADWDLVSAASEVKAAGGLSYPDAFCLVTAERLRAPLLTGDPEIIDRAPSRDVEVIDLRG